MTFPTGTAITSHCLQICKTFSTFSGATRNIIRSWLSDTQISQGDSPSSFNGTLSRWISAPISAEYASSPQTQESPPPPKSFKPSRSPFLLHSRVA